MFKLTIIVPIYNVEKYILDCIQSIIKQIDDSIEVICIDDGSTDDSIKLLKTYLDQIPKSISKNIKILQQENLGVSSARNLGIAHAKGMYITFLDSDDILLNSYSKEIKPALLSNADIITFGYQNLSENLKPTAQYFIPNLFDNNENYQASNQNILIQLFNYNRWFSGIRLYKANLFKEINFPDLTHYEDAATIPCVIIKAKSFYNINKPLYGYRIRSSSATNSKKSYNIDRSLNCLEQLLPTFIEQAKIYPIFIIPLMHFFYIYLYQSTRFKNKKTAKTNWKKFSFKIQEMANLAPLIKNEHNRTLYHCLKFGFYGFYLSKFISRLLRSAKKRLGQPYHQ